jgi:penicillin-binding protein 2
MKHGILFGESIKTEKIRRRSYDGDHRRSPFNSRGFLLPLVVLIVFVIFFFKLFSLQIVQGRYYQILSDSNRTRSYALSAPRGIIFDRNGVPLVFNVPGFLKITKDKEGIIKTEPVEKEKALELITKGAKDIGVTTFRQYPYKDVTSHILGYIGQISQEELKTEKFKLYPANDWIGKSGIEQEYEELLRGTDGIQLVEVDALGKMVRPLGQTDPIPGQDVRLTIDSKLQQAVFDAASDVQKGSIIVSKPNGEILAMLSKPTYDANLFTLDKIYEPATNSAYQEFEDILLDSENQPLFNRAIGGVYPPGSTFKIITAAAGLESVIDEKYSVEDTGVLKVGDFSYGNWFYIEQGKTEPGRLDVIRALSRSNDIFFYKLAEKINVDRLSFNASKFGVGKKLGIDLSGEAEGLLPGKDWKKNVLKEDWYLGDTYHYGIGQGYLLTTPLQVNAWTQVIASGGVLYQPHILNQSAQVKGEKFLSEKTIDLIRRGMVDSCEKGGVAYPLFDFKVKNSKLKVDGKNFLEASSKPASGSGNLKDYREIPVACKTGTAQHGGEETPPHAWITLFAPAYKPEVVVTVLVESGGQGSSVAAPIAKKVLEAYFGE